MILAVEHSRAGKMQRPWHVEEYQLRVGDGLHTTDTLPGSVHLSSQAVRPLCHTFGDTALKGPYINI